MTSSVCRINYNNIDLIKLCMAIFVVATHASLFSIIRDDNLRHFIITALSIKVPFFFTASGFLVWHKICNADKNEKLKRIKRWINKTFRLYFVWSFLYLPYTIYGYRDLDFVSFIIQFIKHLFFVGENYLSWPLWYLLATLIASCMLFILIRRNCSNLFIYLCAVLMALLGIGLNYCENKDVPYLIKIYFDLFQSTRNGFFQGFPYIVIGMAIASHGVIRNKCLLTFLLLLSLILHMLGIEFATFIMTWALFSIVVSYDFKPNALYKNCRLTSTVIYLTHMIWIGFFVIFYPNVNSSIVFLISVIMSIMTAIIVIKEKNNRFCKYLFC